MSKICPNKITITIHRQFLTTCILAEETDFETGHFCNFRTSVALTIWHTVVYHSSTYNYITNFAEIGKTFCGRTDGRTDIWTLDSHWDRLYWADLDEST